MQQWTVHLDGGPRRVNHAATLIGDKIYSFGGYCSGEDYETRRPMDVHILDTATYRWRAVPLPSRTSPQYSVAPYQRYGHTVVNYRGRAYIWGGRNDGDGACDILYEFDPPTNSWSLIQTSGITPPARDGHSACLMGASGDQMVVFGGFEEEFQRFSNETYLFDFRNLKWMELRTLGTPPQWRDFHTATAIGSKMYVFGGRSDHLGQFHSNKEIYYDHLKYLDLSDSTWYTPTITRSGDHKPSGRRSHSAWEYKGCLYVFGGFNGNDNRHFNDLLKYDPGESRWSRVKPLGMGPKPRRRQCCVVNGSKLFLFGGTSPLVDSPVLNLNDPLWPERNLVDHSDLYVLDMAPTLKTLAMTKVVNDSRLHTQLDTLPADLKWELMAVTHPNKISAPRADSSG